MDLMDYRRKIIANSPHLASASGGIVSFSDGADLPLKSLVVDIDPVQSGTGDPSPTNIRPISGWDSVHLTRCGKNLFSTFEEGDITNSGITFDFSDSDVVKISGKSTATNASSQNKIIGGNTPTPIEFRQGNTYTISLQGTVSISKDNDFRIFLRSNSNENLWFGDSTNGVWTVTPESTFVAERIMFRIRSNGTTANVDAHLQIELGSTAMPYEPYQGQSVTVQLGQTVYSGTLDPLAGVLTVDRVGVAMESLTWNRSTSYSNPLFYATVTGKASDYRKACCSMFRNIGSATIIAAQGFANQSADGDFASSNGNAQIFVRLDSATTVQAFVTAVTGQTIVYPLANPTTIQLTPQQIRTLYGQNNIFADTGNVALEYWAHP